MKTISLADAQSDLAALLDAAQTERVVVHRHGKPSVVLLGIEGYDAEDLQLANSAPFWQLIEKRRKGREVPLAEVRARLETRERLHTSDQVKGRGTKGRKGPTKRSIPGNRHEAG